MAVSTHIPALAAELKPETSSTELIRRHVERLKDDGVPQKVIARILGFGDNYVAMLKKGEPLPLSRVMTFAAAVRLNEQERFELLNTRILELHGSKGEICAETLAQWAGELCGPFGDEKVLVDMWREVSAPSPRLAAGVLEQADVAARVKAVLHEAVQAEYRKQAEEAAA